MLQVLHFRAVVGGTIKGCFAHFAVGDGNVKAPLKFSHFVFFELFLLVGHVAAFAGFAQAIAFDGFGQDNSWCALVFHSGFEGGVHFFGIVPPATQFLELFVREVFDHFEQVGMGAKKVAADVFAGFDGVFLVLTIDDFFHALLKQALRVLFE